MSGDVVNLRQARKRKTEAEKDAKASANRAKFGRTKGEKLRDAQRAEALKRHVDGHERDDEA